MKKILVAVLLSVLALSAAQAQKLTAAGATFPYPVYSKWFSEYSAAHPGVEINYQSIGSGGGIRQVTTGLVDFGASDMPMTDEALGSSKVKLIHIPTVLGAVVPIFNVPGVGDIKFSGEVLADIFLGIRGVSVQRSDANALPLLLERVLRLVRRGQQSRALFRRQPRQRQWHRLREWNRLWRPGWRWRVFARPPRDVHRDLLELRQGGIGPLPTHER